MNDIRGRTALVTGASSGLGVDFARDLAARGTHLILVARREDLLQTVADELRNRHGVTVDVIALDLGTPEAPNQLYERVQALGRQVDILVNNAGFGIYGEFLSIDWSRERQMLELDILTLVHLTKLFVKDMVARKFGYVLQVASIGGYQPTPLYATYSAAKSFVLNFGEALDYELKGTGVHCTVISPGVTATEFLAVSGQKPTLYQRISMMKSPDVAAMGIKRMLNGTTSFVPGIANAISVWFNRLLPRKLSAIVAYRLMK